MMSLGLFVFELGSLPYQDLQRRTAWRHSETPRVGARPASQFVGPASDDFNLAGYILPALTGDPAGLDTLREMGDSGEAWPLTAGDGVVHGAFRINMVGDTRTDFHQDGTAQRIEFDLNLTRVDDADALSPDARSSASSADLDPVLPEVDADPAGGEDPDPAGT